MLRGVSVASMGMIWPAERTETAQQRTPPAWKLPQTGWIRNGIPSRRRQERVTELGWAGKWVGVVCLDAWQAFLLGVRCCAFCVFVFIKVK